jgi:dihydrofolate synthase/folylpolyglutamate synthase
MPVKELEALATKIFGADRVFSNENLENALKRAIDDAKRPLSDDSVGIVVTGSVVTVGEARSILRRLFSKED